MQPIEPQNQNFQKPIHSRHKVSKSLLRKLLILILYFPILDLITIYTFYICAYVIMGKMPIDENCDSYRHQLTDIDWLWRLNSKFFTLTIFTLVLVLVLGIYYIFKGKRLLDISKKHILISMTLLLIEFFTFINPINGWFLD